ncbi:MAG: DUF2271 domain-containing protein [Pseudomonadota bacterium]
MRSALRLSSIFCGLLLAIQPACADPGTLSSEQANVLGTSFAITLVTNDDTNLSAAEAAALAEIDRLSKILSTYDPDSEIAQLNARNEMIVSAEMIAVLRACEAFKTESNNAISCRLGDIIERWDQAEQSGAAPATAEMRLMAGYARRATVEIGAEDYRVQLGERVSLNLNAIAKGYIIDRALEAAYQAAPGAEGILIDIGGDLAAIGTGPHDGDWHVKAGTGPAAQVMMLQSGAVATSGQSTRDREIDGRSYGHVLSPKDGWPVEEIAEVSVIAPDTMTADAMATALMVMSIADGLRWIESKPDIDAKILAKDGQVFTSRQWQARLVAAADQSEQALTWPEGYEFAVSINIPDLDVANYERPYVAVWIADTRRTLIRVLLLAGDEPRWIEENYFWHRRFGRKAGSLVDAVSEPTRRPGNYTLLWDGRDHNGAVVPDGEYVLHVEAAREHGGHQHESLSFMLSADPIVLNYEAGEELGPVTMTFGPGS